MLHPSTPPPQTDRTLIQPHVSAMTNVCFVHIVSPDFDFVHVTLVWKCALQLDGSAASPPSLFTFLPLTASHRECHQPSRRLMPVNMAARLSARSVLLSLLFALTLDEFIKGRKRKGTGENS